METNTPENPPKEQGGDLNRVTEKEPKEEQPKTSRQMDLEELIKIIEQEEENKL